MFEDPIYNHIWTEEAIEEVKRLQGPIFVIGASGFIGSKLFFSLSKYRDDVFACSRTLEKSWRLNNVPQSKMVNLDITSYGSLKSIINNYKPQTVFNLSAYGAYARQTDTIKTHVTNYIGTLYLIKALSETGCNALVHTGSSSEYGLNCINSDESSELIPNSDYSVSKVSASYLIKYYGKIYNFPCVNLRLYSIYGPWEERDRLIPTLITNGQMGKFPQFADKNISRDFVYIDDCNNALIKSALIACRTNPGISINIASGIRTTLEDVANTSQKLFDIDSYPVFGSMANRKWDLSNWYGNPSLAEKILNWKSQTSFKDGLKYTLEWEKIAEDKLKYVSIPVKSKKISAIIACYKDNQSIPILHERLTKVFKQTGNEYEIIFVNDASPYNDEEVIENLCQIDNHVIGISHSRNFGSQSAFVSGMEISTGDAVVLMDGDGQDPPEIIIDFAKKWEEGYQIVYGQRVKREAPIYMQLLYKLFYRIFKILSDIKIPLDAGDFSLIDRKAVNHILKFTEKDIFLRGLRAWIGFKQIGVEYHRPERLFGKSTNNMLKNIWWAKKGIFSFSTKPMNYIQALGLFFFVITILLGLFYIILYIIKPPTEAKGITTVVLLILGLGSVQLISLSIIGDYMSKVIEEVKNRPKFIRSKIFTINETLDDDEQIRNYILKNKSI